MTIETLPVSNEQIAEFCRRWQVREFSLFGSVVRGEARADSDVDVLVTFAPDAPWSLFDIVRMQEELEVMFGRYVDVVEELAIRNPFRRERILQEKRVLYAA